MSKLKQRQRQRARAKATRPRAHPPTSPAQTLHPALGGLTPQELVAHAGLLAADLRTAALKAQALSHGGASAAAVMDWFLTPLKRVYLGMDLVAAACLAQAPAALRPACTVGCFACCRLYVEVGPWEAFGIADYVTTAWETGVVPREYVMARLQQEVAQYAATGKDGPFRLCAFVSRDGRCSIYPARPAACRAYYSNSRANCEQYFLAPVLEDDGVHNVIRTADHGIQMQLTLAETQVGRRPPFPQSEDVPAYEMQSAVLRILETPNALVRYLHGEDIFAGCARHSPEAELHAAY